MFMEVDRLSILTEANNTQQTPSANLNFSLCFAVDSFLTCVRVLRSFQHA